MLPTLAALPKGHQFPATEFALTLEWVQEYIAAVEDEAIGAVAPGRVPPMALVALAIRSLLQRASLPPGSVHAAQGLSFARAVAVGERLRVTAAVISRGERQGWVLMSIDLAVSDASGATVMTGHARLSFPAGDAR